MLNRDFNSIIELIKAFPNEQACIEHLEELRWDGVPVSPFDPTSKVYKCAGNKYKCRNTGKYFNVRTATLFDNTKVELQKWFLAIYIVTSHKKGISSMQLAKDIDVTQKTAWFMLQRIRNCFGIDINEPMQNEVEIDETYIGGEMQNKHKSKRAEFHAQGRQTGMNDKKPVLGMLERDGKVRCTVLDRAQGTTIKPILFETISKTATVITDGFGAYTGIAKVFTKHVVINHAQNEYVVGSFHTNTIEGFWSLLKRGIIGIYHFVSDKHLQKYLNEFAFRYNSRAQSENQRVTFFLSNMEHRLTYNKLVYGV